MKTSKKKCEESFLIVVSSWNYDLILMLERPLSHYWTSPLSTCTSIVPFCQASGSQLTIYVLDKTYAVEDFVQECESFNLISYFFALHKTPFQTSNALKSTFFQAFQIISVFLKTFSSQTLSHPCMCNKHNVFLFFALLEYLYFG